MFVACERLTSELKTQRLKVRGQKKIFHANGKDKKSGVVTLILDKIDFKTKCTTKTNVLYKIKRSIK